MKKIILITVLFSGIIVYSNSNITLSTKAIKVLKKIVKEYSHGILEKEEILTYSYENNLVSKIVTTSKSGDTIEKVRIKYDENGKLKLMNVEMFPTKHMIKATSITNVYYYTEDLITSIVSNQDGNVHYEIFYYNSFKQVEKEKFLRDGKMEGEISFKYFSNGNISKKDFSWSHSSDSTDRYKSYDEKNNPSELIFPSAYLKIYFPAKNNVISSREDAIHYTYQYEYNSNNYPVKITEKRMGGKKTITTIEYE